ncbi:MAG: class I SAM-dependent methyltransferase, partial [Proteobacteria bacterium]
MRRVRFDKTEGSIVRMAGRRCPEHPNSTEGYRQASPDSRRYRPSSTWVYSLGDSMSADSSNQPPEKAKKATNTNYGRIARVYQLGAYLGSGGQIQVSKKHHIGLLRKPSKILYPGAGIGIEVAEAAKAGHEVTIVELNPTMLETAKDYMRQEGVEDKVRFILGSVLDHNEVYDVVVANYFLCVFDQEMMRTMLRHLTGLLKKDGLM